MPKRIRRPEIDQRLHDKFDLDEPRGPTPAYLSDDVQKIISIDELLRVPKGQQTTGAATTRVDTYTVPLGKRWRMKYISASRQIAQSITAAVIYDGVAHRIDQVGATGLTLNIFTDLIVDEDDGIEIGFGTAASGVLLSDIIYEEEDAF